MGTFQMYILTAAGLCFAADAMQVLLLSFLSEVLRAEWKLSSDQTASISSVLFAGAMVGTLILGPMADHCGRKPGFLMAASIIAFFGIAVAFSQTYTTLLAMIAMVGVGVGGLTVPFDIFAEFLPAHARGTNLLLIEYFWTIGILLVVFIAYCTLGGGAGDDFADSPNQNHRDPWRIFVILCSLPCCLSVVLGIFFVPESPRWLCTKGRCDQALDIIRRAAKVNHLDVDLVFPESLQLTPEHEEENSNPCELFTPKWRWTTFKLWGAWGAFAFGYYGTIMAITRIFDNEGHKPNNNHIDNGNSIINNNNIPIGNDSYNFDYGAIFISSSAEVVGTTFAILLVDTVGRIPLQVVSYAMAGICVCSLCVLASNEAPRDLLIVFGFSARIFEMAGSCVSWVGTAEILTTEVRTTGASIYL